MSVLVLLLIIAAIACFLLAAFGGPLGRVAAGWLGLALLAVVQLLATIT